MLKGDCSNNNLLHVIWKMGHFVMLKFIFVYKCYFVFHIYILFHPNM
jgi:hypothetical protein